MFSDAVTSFNKALDLDHKDKDALINLGNCHMSLGDFEMSVKTYHEALVLDRECVMSHYNLASAHHSAATSCPESAKAKAHYEAARSEFRAAIGLKPDYADAYFNLGICYQDEGLLDEARQSYLKAVQLSPDMTEAIDAIAALDSKAQ
mmetsp:Transcript_22991/g.51854  ORF Transcript_22991/g.51854 Transcript_22991/m.51854 type:complete len:148 (-) Transcript_22991:331-774(-)